MDICGFALELYLGPLSRIVDSTLHYIAFGNCTLKAPPIKTTNQRSVNNNLPQTLGVWGAFGVPLVIMAVLVSVFFIFKSLFALRE